MLIILLLLVAEEDKVNLLVNVPSIIFGNELSSVVTVELSSDALVNTFTPYLHNCTSSIEIKKLVGDNLNRISVINNGFPSG